MPIRPEERDRYPKNWPAIARAAKEDAGWVCECDGRCGHDHGGRCGARHGDPHPVTGSKVVLTAAHLNHTPEDCRRENLMIACQRCHNAYDREHRAATRRAAREAKTGQQPLAEEMTTR